MRKSVKKRLTTMCLHCSAGWQRKIKLQDDKDDHCNERQQKDPEQQ